VPGQMSDLTAAVAMLYAVFGRYQLCEPISYCRHCVASDEAAELATTPLREIPAELMGLYARTRRAKPGVTGTTSSTSCRACWSISALESCASSCCSKPLCWNRYSRSGLAGRREAGAGRVSACTPRLAIRCCEERSNRPRRPQQRDGRKRPCCCRESRHGSQPVIGTRAPLGRPEYPHLRPGALTHDHAHSGSPAQRPWLGFAEARFEHRGGTVRGAGQGVDDQLRLARPRHGP
jgi:hypothetical protein